MSNLDEKIIKMRQKQQNKNSTSETPLEGDFYKHEVILENQLEILLPTNFSDMPIEIAKEKYPSEERPQCIKTDSSTMIDIGISLHDEIPIAENSIADVIEDMKYVLKKTNPAMEFYESGIEELEDFNIGWMDYKSFAIDDQMYNIMFVASVKGKMLHGVFNCGYSAHVEWRDRGLQIIKSIRFNKE